MTDQQDPMGRLPELPEPKLRTMMPETDWSHGHWVYSYDAGQMRAYALEAAAQLGRVDGTVRYVRWHPKHGYRWDDTHETPFHDYARAGWSSIPLYTHPQLPEGMPEYDRELIADMLDDMCAKVPNSDTKYSHWSIQEMARLLRAADNRDAEGVHTARRDVSVPSREACFDLWMATDEDHSSLGEHIHRFAKRLLAAAPQPDNKESR